MKRRMLIALLVTLTLTACPNEAARNRAPGESERQYVERALRAANCRFVERQIPDDEAIILGSENFQGVQWRAVYTCAEERLYLVLFSFTDEAQAKASGRSVMAAAERFRREREGQSFLDLPMDYAVNRGLLVVARGDDPRKINRLLSVFRGRR